MATDPAEQDLTARRRAAAAAATHHLTGGRPSPAQELRSLADHLDELTASGALKEGSAGWDSYGEHGTVALLERRVAELLGTDDAVFFPSGVMAQEVALRVHCDAAGTSRVAMPNLSHLLVHEEDGPRRLHGFEVEHLTTGPRVATAEDLAAIPGRLGAVLAELPLRDGSYLLPTWDELTGLASACRERGVALHLDGARLWESQPWFDRPLAEIAGLADSVYVSFYKGLAGLAGAALAGTEELCREARVWRRRQGGTLFTLMPYAAAALRGLDEHLPQMAQRHEYAVAWARALAERGLRTVPSEPHAVAFRVYAPDEADAVSERALQAVERDRIGLPLVWQPADVPGWAWCELTVTGTTLEFAVDEAADRIAAVAGQMPLLPTGVEAHGERP